MNQKPSKIIIEENTIYEIDLECLQKKEMQKKERKKAGTKNNSADPCIKKE
ncbi:MAG: hypothetical protein PHG16_13190 [Lachnospiraceae bacterium]|nr:hypothetical protein [Lachnospiraceae bacterium]